MELFRYSYLSYSGVHSTQWLDYQNSLENIAVDINSLGYDLFKLELNHFLIHGILLKDGNH